MMQFRRLLQWLPRLGWSSAIALLALLGSDRVQAQITPEPGFGTTVDTRFLDRLNLIRIQNGVQLGTNLFHSFLAFNVATGQTAQFLPGFDVRNILVRVIGGNASTIDGTLRTPDSTNLFLMNPNGVIFGPNAQLRVGGSFMATTANGIQFENQAVFPATTAPVSPLLTVQPSALLFNQIAAQPVRSQAHLAIGRDRTLALVGGTVELSNGSVLAPNGRVELAAINGNVTLGFTATATGWQLASIPAPQLADITLQNTHLGNNQPHQIQLQGRDIVLTQGSRLNAPENPVTINSRTLILANQSRINTRNNRIKITVADIYLTDDSFINAESGSVELTGDRIQLNNRSYLNAATGSIQVTGNAIALNHRSILNAQNGSIQLTGNTIGLTQNSIVNADNGTIQAHGQTISLAQTSVFNARNGNIQVQGADIRLDQNARIDARNGRVQIAGDRIAVQGVSQIGAGTEGDVSSGGLTVTATESIELVGGSADGQFASGLFTTAIAGRGRAADITLVTPLLMVRDGARIEARTESEGPGGNIAIVADRVQVSGTSIAGRPSSILATTERGSGGAGNITVSTRELVATGGGRLSTSTFNGSRGTGGNLSVYASDAVRLSGKTPDGQLQSGLLVGTAGDPNAGNLQVVTPNLTVEQGAVISANSGGRGRSGDVTVRSDRLTVQSGAEIGVRNGGGGAAGNLTIDSNQILLDTNGKLTAETTSGNGGNIEIQASDLMLMRRGAQVSTTAGTAQSGGNGGNIRINTPFLIALPSENSDITANAFTGKGGNVEITAQAVIGLRFRPELTAESDITASSTFGTNGVVTINTPDVDPSRGLGALPVTLVDPTQQVRQGCTPRSPHTASQFIATGRGGIPLSPANPLTPRAAIAPWVTLSPHTATAVTPPALDHAAPPTLIEAQGWQVSTDGSVYLTAPTSTASGIAIAPTARCP